MGDDYFLRTYLKDKIKVDKIIDFFSNEGVKYFGFWDREKDVFSKIPVEEAIKNINESKGMIILNTVDFEIHIMYLKKYNNISLSFGGYLFRDYESELLELLKEYVKFMKENYPVVKMTEEFGYKQEYPFALQENEDDK